MAPVTNGNGTTNGEAQKKHKVVSIEKYEREGEGVTVTMKWP